MEVIGIGFIKTVVALVMVAVTAITSWMLGVRMRRRIKRTLGIRARNEMELTSIKTWTNVENVEENNRSGKLY
jgi:hypothetical protein